MQQVMATMLSNAAAGGRGNHSNNNRRGQDMATTTMLTTMRTSIVGLMVPAPMKVLNATQRQLVTRMKLPLST